MKTTQYPQTEIQKCQIYFQIQAHLVCLASLLLIYALVLCVLFLQLNCWCFFISLVIWHIPVQSGIA